LFKFKSKMFKFKSKIPDVEWEKTKILTASIENQSGKASTYIEYFEGYNLSLTQNLIKRDVFQRSYFFEEIILVNARRF